MSASDGVARCVIDQVVDAQTEHPDLELTLERSGQMLVQGTVSFCIDHDGRRYKDAYELAIAIPPDYPASVPTVKETAGAIPDTFHRDPVSGDLCLAAPVELRRVFAQGRTLLHFINRLLIPYLFSYTYYRAHDELPHGELSHGLLGLLEYYQDFFNTGPVTAMKLLKPLADGIFPQMSKCPCGSGKLVKACHGPKLAELRNCYSREEFEAELRAMVLMARAADIRLPESEVTPRRMARNRSKRQRRKRRRRQRR